MGAVRISAGREVGAHRVLNRRWQARIDPVAAAVRNVN